jgi:RIO-like serine/threonine protein kinase
MEAMAYCVVPQRNLVAKLQMKGQTHGFSLKKLCLISSNIMRKKGVLQLAFQLSFELHQTLATHRIYML